MEASSSTVKPFYIVHFKEENSAGIQDVCVPHSWVSTERTEEGLIRVSYPIDESKPITEDRVENEENVKQEWPLRLAEIKYKAESYEDAARWLAANTSDSRTEQHNSRMNCTEPKKEKSRHPSLKVLLDRKALIKFIKKVSKISRSSCHHNGHIPVLPLYDHERNLIGICKSTNSSRSGSHNKVVIKDFNFLLKSDEDEDEEDEEEEVEDEEEMELEEEEER